MEIMCWFFFKLMMEEVCAQIYLTVRGFTNKITTVYFLCDVVLCLTLLMDTPDT